MGKIAYLDIKEMLAELNVLLPKQRIYKGENV
jgi:hypothetical protein